MKIFTKARSIIETISHDRFRRNIFHKYKDFTMVPEQIYKSNLEIAVMVQKIPGCIVECGVWKGGMIAGISEITGKNRNYYCFDSFEGLPPAKDIDGESAIRWQKDTTGKTYYENCKADPNAVHEAFELSGVKKYHIIKGWFEETIPTYSFEESIALLRIDADWYDSTSICLESLYDKVAIGGIIIFDDYFTWDGCSRAVHDFLSRRTSAERLRNYSGISYLLKTCG